MTYFQQSIPIVSAFDRLKFPTGLFPSDRMLIELLHPDIDPTFATLNFRDASEHASISDLKSQMILKKWSNAIIQKILDIQNADGHLIDKLCYEQGVKHREARYHYAVTMYIGVLFPAKRQNLKKLASVAMQMSSTYIQYRKGHLLAIGDNCEQLLGFNSVTKTFKENPHKLYLRQRFLDYRIADDFLTVLYSKAVENKSDELLAYLNHNQIQRDSFSHSRRDSYPQQVDNLGDRPVGVIGQCPDCLNWFEKDSLPNGKLVRCATTTCKTEQSRSRREKSRKLSNKNPFVKSSDTKKLCVGTCGKIRMVNIDRLCKKCLNEKITDAEKQT